MYEQYGTAFAYAIIIISHVAALVKIPTCAIVRRVVVEVSVIAAYVLLSAKYLL